VSTATRAGRRPVCRPGRLALTDAAAYPGTHVERVGGDEVLVRYAPAAAQRRWEILAEGRVPEVVEWRNDWSRDRTPDNPMGLPIQTIVRVR
jgi:hypothetical protein